MTAIPDIRNSYKLVLRRHVHELIAMGYARLDAPKYFDWEEPTITGELVRSIRAAIESDEAPAWAVYYSVADDPPISDGIRFGKARPRVDIEFERTGGRGKRLRLCFEAKRLGKTKGHTVSAYLGIDGLGCFVSGKYPTTHLEAGMLGYVQTINEADWADGIQKELTKNSEKYGAISLALERQDICSLHHTYASRHHTSKQGDVLVIHHILLRFH